MQSPKVSIIVPIYNVEAYLDRCMHSLLNQTLKEIEILLIDDGSPDRCPNICDEYACNDSRVRVIHKENAGLGFARNSGIDIAIGEYIAFVDSDDFVDSNMYEDLYREAILSNADVVFAGFKIETQSGTWKESNEVKFRKEWNGIEIQNFMFDMIACAPNEKKERKYRMSVWHSIYKTSIIRDDNLRFPSERIVVSEDIPFQVDFLLRAKKIVYLPQSYYYYCLNGSSLSKTFLIEKFERFKNLRLLLISKIESDIFIQRVNRLFVGYTRSYLQKLLFSNQNNKLSVVANITNDKIWMEVGKILSVRSLPIHSRILYFFILRKCNRLILIYIKLYQNFKKII